MTNLSEDPTYLAGTFLLLAGAFLIALKVTQRGMYLVYSAVALGLAVTVVMVEWLWVTDTERIEQVVYDLRQAVLSSDAETVLGHMAPDVQYVHGDMALSGNATRALIRNNLSHTRFEFVRISELQTSVGQQSRRGKAEFRAFTRGTLNSSQGTAVTGWSLGFQETAPGVWKVNRISLISTPQGMPALPGGLSLSDGTHSSVDVENGIVRPVRRSSSGLRGPAGILVR
jgi:ketosteroid isomerase-like protein